MMKETIYNLYDNLIDVMPAFCAVLICILILLLGVGLSFGLSYGWAWVVMWTYNQLAATFSWPTFSIWFWFAATFVIKWYRRGLFTVSMKGKKED